MPLALTCSSTPFTFSTLSAASDGIPSVPVAMTLIRASWLRARSRQSILSKATEFSSGLPARPS